jgi:hypothetical protein
MTEPARGMNQTVKAGLICFLVCLALLIGLPMIFFGVMWHDMWHAVVGSPR